jgi:predicted ArsR family transcriptional regulator
LQHGLGVFRPLERALQRAANAAARLGLSEETVRTHLEHVYVKLARQYSTLSNASNCAAP